MRKTLLASIAMMCLTITACGGSQNATPTRPAPTATTALGDSTPTSISVVLTPVVVTGDVFPTATIAPTLPTPDQVPTYNPGVSSPAAPDEVVFIRPGGGAPEFVLGIGTVEVWAVARDGSNPHLLTTYNPDRNASFTVEFSPDRRLGAVSDQPGAVLIDFQQGTKTVLLRLEPTTQWASQFVWSRDSKSVDYAVHDSAAGSVTLYQQTVDPLGTPQPLIGNFTLNGVALYPNLTLPDGRVLLYAATTETYFDAAVYDPVRGTVSPLTAVGFEQVSILDARGDNEVIFQPISTSDALTPQPLYIGTLTAEGQITGAYQVTDVGYSRALFLPNGGFAALGTVEPTGSHVYLFPEPANQTVQQGQRILFPDDGDVEIGFGLLDANTLLVNRYDPPELWIAPPDGGTPYELINITGAGQ